MITLRVSISLDPDQAGCFVSPDLGPNCLQKFLADDTGKVSSEFFQNNFFDDYHESAYQFGSRSGWVFCQS